MTTTKGTHMNITHTITTSTGETVPAISRSEWSLSIEQREANSRISRRDAHRNPECHLCGRKMSKKASENATHVHMTIGAELVPVAAELGDESQGFFAVGSECAKKVPAAFKTKFGA